MGKRTEWILNNGWIFIIIIFVLSALWAMFVFPTYAEYHPKGEIMYVGNDVYRIIDHEQGVVCYQYGKAIGGALDCLPLNETGK